MRTSYSNQVRASPASDTSTLAIGDSKGIYQQIVQDECGLLWFHHFKNRIKNQMGQVWKFNRAMSIPLLLRYLEWIEKTIEESATIMIEHNGKCYAYTWW